MKLLTLGLAVILSLVLMAVICPSVQASEEEGSVDLTATVPLTISDVSASSIGYHSATISWKTDGDATSQVFYDIVSHDDVTSYAYKTTEDLSLVSVHSVRLTGLSSGRTYHYRVRSAIPDTDFIAISEKDCTFSTSKPAAGDGGGAAPHYYIDTNLFGVEERYRTSLSGELQETIEATSEDGNLTIILPQGNVALGKDGKRLKGLEAAVDESPPDPPEDANIIGLAYDFGPDGATFDPPMVLTWHYDPDTLPEGVAEKDLVLAYYDEDAGKWVELTCTVDPVTHIITAAVSHFTTFAIIAPVLASVPPPAPAPAAFSLSNLTVQPAEVQPKETVIITVAVANTGGMEGSYTVVLKLSGVKEADKSVTIAAGSTQTVSFSVTKAEAGSYSVAVDGLSGSFTVLTPQEMPPVKTPVNWPLVGGIIGAVIVVTLVVFYFVRKRAKT